jgi:hypothetical protein
LHWTILPGCGEEMVGDIVDNIVAYRVDDLAQPSVQDRA